MMATQGDEGKSRVIPSPFEESALVLRGKDAPRGRPAVGDPDISARAGIMRGTLCALCWRSATFGAKLAAAQVGRPALCAKTFTTFGSRVLKTLLLST